MTVHDLQQVRAHRTAIRNKNLVEEVLEFANKKGVTLKQLEALARTHLSPKEEMAAGLKHNRQKIQKHQRALNANRVRWERARKFLEGSSSHEEKIAKFSEGISPLSPMLEGEILPQPEAPFIPAKEFF